MESEVAFKKQSAEGQKKLPHNLAADDGRHPTGVNDAGLQREGIIIRKATKRKHREKSFGL